MPWRLLGLVLILAVFLAFIGLNLDNRCVISFGLWETKNPVPVFLPIFASFVLGLLFAIPFAVSLSVRRSKKSKSPKPGKAPHDKGASSPEDSSIGGPYDID
jgi:uncharacterized integral membrane protein